MLYVSTPFAGSAGSRLTPVIISVPPTALSRPLVSFDHCGGNAKSVAIDELATLEGDTEQRLLLRFCHLCVGEVEEGVLLGREVCSRGEGQIY